jgi:uncharacterized membrane-anchored protein
MEGCGGEVNPIIVTAESVPIAINFTVDVVGFLRRKHD